MTAQDEAENIREEAIGRAAEYSHKLFLRDPRKGLDAEADYLKGFRDGAAFGAAHEREHILALLRSDAAKMTVCCTGNAWADWLEAKLQYPREKE